MNQLYLQVCLGVEKAPLGEAQKDDGGFQFENVSFEMFILKKGGGGGFRFENVYSKNFIS